MRYGVQMYGVNPIFLKDKTTFLARVSDAGYRYLEPCLMLQPIPGLEDRAWTPEDFGNYLPMLRMHNLSVYSCHVFTQNILRDLPQLIPLAKKWGLQQLVLPCPAFTDLDQFQKCADILKEAANILAAEQIDLLLHNDRGDSSARIDGISAYEWMLHRCGDTVGAQADVGWLLYGGTNPEEFLWRNRTQVRSLHYKDFKDTVDGLRETAIGTGMVDMVACFQFARAAEIIQIADQDGSEGDFLQDLRNTADSFRELAQCRDNTRSILCTMDTVTGEVTKLHTFEYVIEAPNWMQRDDDTLIYNSDGFIYKYSIASGTSQLLETGHCRNCNNDHVLSPDNTHIAVSHSAHGWMSQIYILPIAGGEPRLITPNAPSFLHGWSPDGNELAYCAFRDHGSGMEVDVYAIPAAGGEEIQLTRNAAFNDGPEYAPDGKHIWFNSTRSGLMQCWRMERDGSNPTQMTFSQRNNWFPHVSPDGKQVVYLSYSKDGLDASEHLPNMDVQLRLMNSDGTNDRCLLEFFGGQGSINVNSWKNDSRHIAFVIYELDHK